MFQFVNGGTFFTAKWSGKYALIIKKIFSHLKSNDIQQQSIALNGKTK
jgi:hypothetical protein